jgi:hypothetical protein
MFSIKRLPIPRAVYRNSRILLHALICFGAETIDESTTYNIKNYYKLMFYNENKIPSMEIIVKVKIKL